jgi:hypothetical protein
MERIRDAASWAAAGALMVGMVTAIYGPWLGLPFSLILIVLCLLASQRLIR